MKKENLNYWFAGLFSSKAKTTTSEPTVSAPSEVFTTAAAQPYVLQGMMREKKLTHGETVMATLSPVRLEEVHGRMALYFCPMKELSISESITSGDGGDIPAEVAIEGLKLPAGYKSGLYALKNVRLTSNGAIQVKSTSKTSWETVHA